MADDHNGIARLFKSVALEQGGRFDVVLDFGCGAGRLVEAMHDMGVSKIWRISPFRGFIEYLSREFRMGLIAKRKAP